MSTLGRSTLHRGATLRIDTWLWAVRLFKTRSAAATLLRAGRVFVNDGSAKPATQLKLGDRISWREPMREREIEVVQLIPKRVSAPLAVEAYVDHSPPLPTREDWTAQLLGVGLRDRGSGRPTKKDRRDLDHLRNRPANHH